MAGAFLAGAFLAGAFFAGAAFLAGADLLTIFLAPETTALNSVPGRNLGSLVALIFTVSPVRGLRPRRALRAWLSNTPKPLTATFSPRTTAFLVSSMNASTMSVTSRLLWPSRPATASISSALFTSTPPEGVRPAPICRRCHPTCAGTPHVRATPTKSLWANGFTPPGCGHLCRDPHHVITRRFDRSSISRDQATGVVVGFHAGRVASKASMASACFSVMPMSSSPSIRRQRT